jgi:hypothetical protein
MVSEGVATVTSEQGEAQLELGVGPQALSVWHPPVKAGGPGLHAELEIEVQGQMRRKKTVDLGKETN